MPCTPEAPGIARHWVSEHFSGELNDPELASAKLLVSELVTNSIVHGRGGIALSARVDAEYLRVDVKDGGKRFTRGIQAPNLDRAGGWGLQILDAEATHWGIGEGATTHVWFELARSVPTQPVGN